MFLNSHGSGYKNFVEYLIHPHWFTYPDHNPFSIIKNIVKEIKAGLTDIYSGQLKGLYLYGSYSRNDADSESDIDILIVLENIESYSGEIGKTSILVSELSLKYDVTISRVFVTQQDWAKKETPFLSNARKEAIAA